MNIPSIVVILLGTPNGTDVKFVAFLNAVLKLLTPTIPHVCCHHL